MFIAALKSRREVMLRQKDDRVVVGTRGVQCAWMDLTAALTPSTCSVDLVQREDST